MVDLNFSAECEALAHGDAKPLTVMGAAGRYMQCKTLRRSLLRYS